MYKFKKLWLMFGKSKEDSFLKIPPLQLEKKKDFIGKSSNEKKKNFWKIISNLEII